MTNCTVRMFNEEPCGRPIASTNGRCILHTADREKDADAFNEAVRSVVSDPGADVFDFTDAWFPEYFDWCGATAAGTLEKPLYFVGASFGDGVSFEALTCKGVVVFQNCKFESASFVDSSLEAIEFNDCSFGKAILDGISADSLRMKRACFDDAVQLDAGRAAAKLQLLELSDLQARSLSLRTADIHKAVLTNVRTEEVLAENARFDRLSISASTLGRAHLPGIEVRELLEVLGARSDAAHTFESLNLDAATIAGEFRFLGTTADPILSGVPDAESRLTNIAWIGECRASLQGVDVSRCLFAGTGLKSVALDRTNWHRSGRRRVLYDERKLLASKDRDKAESALEYDRIAKAYRQLRENFEKNLEYAAASDFHVGEMEMERLKPAGSGGTVRLWYRRRLSLLAFYRYLSLYGASYERAALWMLLVVLFFGAFFLVAGIATSAELEGNAGTPQVIKYRFELSLDGLETALRPKTLSDYGRALLASLGAFSFQDTPYNTITSAGRLLEMVEGAFAATLVAMFLLAVRRRFKR